MLERLEKHGLDWREYLVPGTTLWQIFTYDPNGVLLELTYDADAEAMPAPVIPEAKRSRPGVNFFDPERYRSFRESSVTALG
jgi:hypothetical protein